MRKRQMVNEEDEARFASRSHRSPRPFAPASVRALGVSMARLGAGKLGQALDR